MKLLSLPLFFVLGASSVLAAGNSPTLAPPSVFSSLTKSVSGSISATPTTSGNSSSTSASTTSSAQYPSLSGVSTCVTTCLEMAISASNCTSVVDVNCFCVSGKFPPGIVSCVSTSCPDQLSSAEQLSQQFCNLASTSKSLSFPTPSSTVPSSSGSATSPSSATSTAASSTGTQSGGGTRLAVGNGGGLSGWMSVGVALMGVLGGALVI